MRVLSNTIRRVPKVEALQSQIMGERNEYRPIRIVSRVTAAVHSIFLADARVQRAEGSSSSKDGGVLTQPPGAIAKALLHAAGQRMRVLVQCMAQADGIPEWQRCGPAPRGVPVPSSRPIEVSLQFQAEQSHCPVPSDAGIPSNAGRPRPRFGSGTRRPAARPSSRICPLLGFSWPSSRRQKGDLPQARSATMVNEFHRLATSRLRFFSTTLSSYCCQTLRIEIALISIGSLGFRTREQPPQMPFQCGVHDEGQPG